jgi:hypothetical protein
LKLYRSIFILTTICLAACSGTGKDDHSITDSEVQKPTVELKSKGLEDLSESTNLKDILCQAWEYKEDAADAESISPYSNVEMQYRGYCFFSDGKLIKDPRGYVKTGKWSLLENTKPIRIVMTFDDGSAQTEIPGSFNPTELIFAGQAGGGRPAVLSANAHRHINVEEDPFYPGNAWWMIKPTSPQTDPAIKKRFRACLHFFILFYEEYVNVHAKKVSFVGLPSPYKWYAGGIILQKENKLTPKWMNCFYNDEQAIKAYRLADKLFDKKYDWPKDEGQWMKRNLGVLKQMEKRLDSINC